MSTSSRRPPASPRRPPTFPRRLTAPLRSLCAIASRLRAFIARLLADPFAPTVVLSLILVFSLYARVLHLGQPCTQRCKTAAEHTLIFDEAYYVNAARIIDHIEPPAGAPYHGAPKGKDPNAEHPQLAKLVIAAGIKLFGDTPRGWRIGSVLFGLIGMVALFALVRAAGGGAWLAIGAVAVMSLDNLLLVHGRIATLDIYAVAMMLVAGALYLRRWPLLAGLALAVAACMKEVALYLLLVVLLLEALRFLRARFGPHREAPLSADTPIAPADVLPSPGSPPLAEGPAPTDAAITVNARVPANTSISTDAPVPVPANIPIPTDTPVSASTPPLTDTPIPTNTPPLTNTPVPASWKAPLVFALTSVAGFVGLLWLLDVLVPAYDPNAHVTYGGNPFSHIAHMYDYAQLLKAKPHATGISSTPWQWLLDQKTIDYAKVAVNSLANGHIVAIRPTIFFQGAINPFIIFLAIPATFAAVAAAWRHGEEVAAVGACWCIGTFLPFVYESLVSGRITYLYYMVIVMPGLYLVLARMFSPRRMPLAATLGWSVALIYGFFDLYPLRTLK